MTRWYVKCSAQRLFLILGPGLITGASDDDPSGIATYAQAGAALGLTTLWTALFTLPLMCAVQFVSAKIDFVGINPIDALVWTAVINGFLAPPLLAILMVIANNVAVLGHDVNGPVTNAIGWTTTLLMSVAAIALVVYH